MGKGIKQIKLANAAIALDVYSRLGNTAEGQRITC